MEDFYDKFHIGDKIEIKFKKDIVLKGIIRTMGTVKDNDPYPPKCTSLSIDILDSDKKKEILLSDVIECRVLENYEV